MNLLEQLNSREMKQLVIKQSFPMKIKPNYNNSIKLKSKKSNVADSKLNFKLISPIMTTYQINPTASTKNNKVHLLLDHLSDSFQEYYQMMNQFQFTEKGIILPSQPKLFFETLITHKEYRSFATFPESKEEDMLQNLNFTWYKASKIKKESKLFTLNDNCIGIEFKFKHTSGLSLSVDQRFKEKPMRELLEQSKTLKEKEEIFIQFGIQPAELEWWKEAERRVKNISKRIKTTESTTGKLGMPAFDTVIRLVVKGENVKRSEMLARGLVMAFKQLNGDNELVDKKVKAAKMKKWFTKYVESRKIPVYFFRFDKRMLMTRKEIKHFIKLPERNLQLDFELGVNEREELKVDSLLTRKRGVLIGYAEEKEKKVDIRLPIQNLDDFCNTSVICGSPRSGKDTYFCNTLIESVKNLNVGAFIPDVINEKGNDRGMSDTIRDAFEPSKIIDLNIGDYDNPIYFGLEDVANLIGANGMNVIAGNLVNILNLDDTTDTQELCSLIARVCKCNIYDMYCCLKSKSYAENLYEIVKEEDQLLALEYKQEFLNTKRDRAVSTLRTRLKMILGNPHFKHMMSQDPNPNINFEKWIREKKVVILRMNKMEIGEIGVKILMYLLSMKVFWIKKIIQTDDPTFIVYNEPHQYMSDGLQELMESMVTESPKFRLSQYFLFHHPLQLPNKLWQILISSSVNMYLFKNTNYKLYSDLKEQLKPIEVDTAMKTEKYESIFLPYVEGRQLEPIFVKMLPPPKKRMKMYDNSHLTIEHSKLYGRNVEEVRQKIMEIELSMYAEEKNV